jgi:hypothetical protein
MFIQFTGTDLPKKFTDIEIACDKVTNGGLVIESIPKTLYDFFWILNSYPNTLCEMFIQRVVPKKSRRN